MGAILMTGTVDLVEGALVQFLYPAANFVGVRSKLERRRIRVEHVRVIAADPLAGITKEWQPLLNRGELLVTGFDLDKLATRSFYDSSMVDLELIPAGEVLPDVDHVVAVFEPGVEQSAEEAFRGSAAACLQWAERWLCDSTGLAVSIVPKLENAIEAA